MSKPGHYARERDARRAARGKGLKDDEYELLQGVKGWTWREKKKYVKVEGAKLHVPQKSTKIGVNEPTDVQHVVKEMATGRFRYKDETGRLSMESFETLAEASCALTFANPPPLPLPVPIPGHVVGTPTPEGVVLEKLPVAEEPVVLEKASETAGIQLTSEKRMCPECKRSVDTFVSGDKLHYVEHDIDPDTNDGQVICDMSEEEVVSVPPVTGAPQSDFKSHELAQIQNGDPIPPGTFHPDAVRREVIPRIHRSTVESPSKLVWEIAEEMHKANPNIARREILAECVRRGIAYYTARTQYQVWVTMQKQSAANAEEINKGR